MAITAGAEGGADVKAARHCGATEEEKVKKRRSFGPLLLLLPAAFGILQRDDDDDADGNYLTASWDPVGCEIISRCGREDDCKIQGWHFV